MAIDWNSLKKQEKVLESRLKQYDNRGSSASAPKSTSSPTRANAPSYRTALEGLKAGALPISRTVADRAPALADLEPKTEEQAERLDTAREKTGSDFLVIDPQIPLDERIKSWETRYERASRRVDALRSGPPTARRDQTAMREAVAEQKSAYETLQSLKRRQLNRAYLDRSRKAVRDIRKDSSASEDFEQIGELEGSEATIRRLLDDIARGADPSEYAESAKKIEDAYGVSLKGAGGSVGEYMNQLTDLLGKLPEETERLAKKLTGAGYAVEDAAEYLGRQEDIEAAARGQARWQETAREHPVLASAATVVAAPAQGVEAVGAYLANWGHNASDPETYRPINTARDMSSTRFVDTVRGTVAQELEEDTSLTVGGQNVASFLYQTGMSMADSAVQVAALGKAAPILMGASAASNQVYDVLQRGGTNEEAFWGGVTAGAAEMLFEKVSVENLLKPRTISGWKSVLSSALEQAGVEASEEGLTEIANILSDAAIMGSSSNFERSIQAHMADGDTREEAERKAFLDAIGQVAAASVGGAISGGVMAGVKASVARAERKAADTYTGKTLQQAQENFDLVDMGLNYQEDSETYRQAQAIARKLDTADDPVKAVSAEEYGQLLRAMQSELESKGPKTGEERHDAVQAMHPEEKVITPTAQALIEAGDTPAAADAKSEILDRIFAGDGAVTDSQLRKLDMRAPSTKQVFTARTGIQVPDTADTKTLLQVYRSGITAAQEVQKAQEALSKSVDEGLAAMRRQAAQAAGDAEARSRARTAEATAQAETGADQPAAQQRRQTTVGEVFRPRQERQAPAGQTADAGGARRAEAAAAFRPRQTAQTEPTGIRLSDGTTQTAQEFRAAYLAGHEGATQADADRVYSEAVRLNRLGQPWPAAQATNAGPAARQDGEARSSVSRRARTAQAREDRAQATADAQRRASGQEPSESGRAQTGERTEARQGPADAAQAQTGGGEQAAEREPSRVQRWTADYASALLRGSSVKGVDVAFDGFGEGENAYYVDGRVVLNGDRLTTQRAIMSILGHELTHAAYDADASVVDDILSFAGSLRGEEAIDQLLDETRERYIRFLTGQKGLSREEASARMTPEAVRQEAAGDLMAEAFQDGALVRRLGRQSPRLLRRARDVAETFLRRIRKKQGTSAAAARSELEWLIDKMDQALRSGSEDGTIKTARSSVEDPVYLTEGDTFRFMTEEDERAREERIGKATEAFGLSGDEANGIDLYVSGAAYEWTAIQRGEPEYERTAYTDFWIEQTRAGLEKLPTFQGRTYRNLRFQDVGRYQDFLEKHTRGHDVVLDAFSSASKDPNGYVARGDYAAHLVIDGVTGRDLSGSFTLPGQQEVVYLPGTVLHIDSVTTANDGHPLIYARERGAYGKNMGADPGRGGGGPTRADDAGQEGPHRGDWRGRVLERMAESSMGTGGAAIFPRHQQADIPAKGGAGAQERELTDGADPGAADPRYSISEDNVDPATGYTRGSVADSLMRMINAGDVDAALEMMGAALEQLQDLERRREAQRKQAAAAAFLPKPPLTEDAIAKNKREIQTLIDRYGKMPQTGAAQRVVLLPKQTDPDTRTRGFMQTAAAAESTPEYIVSEIERAILEGDAGATYVSIGNKEALRRAEEQIEAEGVNRLIDRWRAKVELGAPMDKNDIVLGEQLYVEAANSGDVTTAMQLLADIAVAGTQAGQVTQAMSMLKDMTPSGQLYYVQRTVDRINSELEKRIRSGKAKKIVIDPDLARTLLEAGTQEELDTAMEAVIQSVAAQVPVTFADKLNAWRYLAMLGNTKTHIRNVMGNVVFVPARLTKDVLATAIEEAAERGGLLGRDQRTKTLRSSREAKEFAKADALEMEKILRGGGRENISDRIRDARAIFKSKALRSVEGARKLNAKYMEMEDWFFLHRAYESALSKFLTARGADLSTLKGAGSTREGRALLNAARAYAVREAQKATYRDVSRLASTLNRVRRSGGKGTQLFLDAIVPFTKTPVNVVRRGVEYSPVGLARGIFRALWQVHKGQITATEAIDDIAAGLTGTGIIALGYLLAQMGLLTGGFGDDAEDEFQKLQGQQEYSIRILGNSYTIDWASPTALPLFVGAEFYEILHDDAEKAGEDASFEEKAADLAFNAVPEALGTLLEPVLAMSMLDGLNQTLESVRYDSGGNALAAILKAVAENYVSQFIPTAFGQFARTIDDSRRTSFTPAGMGGFQSSLARAFQSSIQSKIPVFSEGRMRYIDAWGRPDTSTSTILRALENFFSPGYADKLETSGMEEELARLAEATGDTGVFPKRAGKSFTVDKEDYAMTQEEYEAHLIDRGQTSYALLTDLVHSPDYAGLTDKEKARAVKAAYDYAAQLARYHTNEGYDIDSWVLRLEATADQFGLDPSDYFVVKARSDETGEPLRETILSAGMDPAATAELIAFEFHAESAFDDPFTRGYEYVLNDEQQDQFERLFRERFVADYVDYGLDELEGEELSEAVAELRSDINAEVKEEMSDRFYEAGIEPTEKK